jgi:putative mRNA 3-end processing factor
MTLWTFGLPVFRHGDPKAELAKLLGSVSIFPEREHLGAYALGVMAMLREGRLR